MFVEIIEQVESDDSDPLAREIVAVYGAVEYGHYLLGGGALFVSLEDLLSVSAVKVFRDIRSVFADVPDVLNLAVDVSEIETGLLFDPLDDLQVG